MPAQEPINQEIRLSTIFNRLAPTSITNLFHEQISEEMEPDEESRRSLEMAPRRRYRLASRGEPYDPNVDYGAVLRRNLARANAQARSRSPKLSADQKFEKLYGQIDFEMSHPCWQSEIKECMSLDVYNKVKGAIAQDLGVLGVLLFIRLQNCLGLSMFKGYQISSQSFLVIIAEHMMKVVSKNSQKYQQVQKQTSAPAPADLEELSMPQQSGSQSRSFKLLKEEVLPLMSEIIHCIKNKLVSSKDLILYKLILDVNEALLSQQGPSSEYQRLARYSVKFYKRLEESEVDKLQEQIRSISQAMKEHQSDTEAPFAAVFECKCTTPFSIEATMPV